MILMQTWTNFFYSNSGWQWPVNIKFDSLIFSLRTLRASLREAVSTEVPTTSFAAATRLEHVLTGIIELLIEVAIYLYR